MPPRKVTLRYYATLPIADEPEYKDGYRCDYCKEYFLTGPFYHCPSTGTDGCIACVENKGQKASQRSDDHHHHHHGPSGAPSAAHQHSSQTRRSVPPFPNSISLFVLPSRELFDESGAALRTIAENFRTAASSTMTNDLFLAATEKSSLVLGYMLQTNVMGALFSTGASLLVVLDGAGGMGPACLAVPGNDAVASCSKALSHTTPHASIYNTIVPVLTEQLMTLFPWVGKLRTALATSTMRPFSSYHRAMVSFVPTPGAWPPFIQLCSATTPSWCSPRGSADGSYLAVVTSEGLLQVLSFVGLHEWQYVPSFEEIGGDDDGAGGSDESHRPWCQRAWGPDGEINSSSQRGGVYEPLAGTREWAKEWLKLVTSATPE